MGSSSSMTTMRVAPMMQDYGEFALRSRLFPQSKQFIMRRFLMTLHAGGDLAGRRDFLAIGRDGAVNPAVVRFRRLGVGLEHDEQVGLLGGAIALAVFGCVREEMVAHERKARIAVLGVGFGLGRD